ncbi:hypothetical protein D3C81_1772780 [compost metagenome]
MRFVRHHDDVRPLANRTVHLGELVDRCKHHAAARAVEELTQVFATFGLYGVLPQQCPAHCKSVEELVVQIVAVGDDHNRGVSHLRRSHERSG